jgi:GTPase SAR1 family protein
MHPETHLTTGGRRDVDTGAAAVLGDLVSRFNGRYGHEPAIRNEIEHVRQNLGEPVQLAVTGFVSCGKSTLINALLRRDVAASGSMETTFRVCELRRGPADTATVVLGDAHGRATTETIGLDQLRRLNVRDGTDLAWLRRVSRIIVTLRSPFLDDVTLIDTPGLGSVFVEDSAETERLMRGRLDAATIEALRNLGLTAEMVDRVSADETRRADAMLYVYRDLPGEHDVDALRRFADSDTQARAYGPLRTVGILSRCDETGEPFELDFNPIEQYARASINRLDPEVSQMFYTILPVAGLVAVGAVGLDEERYDDLSALGQMPPERIVDGVADQAKFKAGLKGAPIEPWRQRRLMTELGPWGTLLAYKYIRGGCGLEEVRERLDKDSGVAAVRQLVREHFGEHAYLIKLSSGLAGIRTRLSEFRRGLPTPHTADDRERIEMAQQALERIEQRETGFAELEIRRAYRVAMLKLSAEEAARMRRLTGEQGRSCADRLGCAATTSLDELERLALEELRYWRGRTRDSTHGAARPWAIETLYELAEGVARRVREARRLLAWQSDVSPR